ncbi:UDP-N-acetyl glucosamine 2-epimerase [Thalassospira lucentensis]|uniref:UDP-N-acetyl glucosamine 2-epimerase n=1 Tax=Thalassospira lucentensis TaxID=168935 RepID=UPI00294278D6|nr:UDP-N-acetylglucosamine 2-epimerase [Thalassospira lucentensis]WOI11157.1 UDP-N-acetylglucosamine 2-epimerase [Thalassospira lucentensis]
MIIDLVYGTRPNLIKAAALYLAWQEKRDDLPFILRLIDTGQHWDPALSEGLRLSLGLPVPEIRLGIGQPGNSRHTLVQNADDAYCRMLGQSPAQGTIVIGDVNGSLGVARAAKRNSTYLIHLEAGLRGGFDAVAEEANRTEIDGLSDMHWAPDKAAADNLHKEGIKAKGIHNVGNIVIDAMIRFGGSTTAIWSSSAQTGPVLLTLHRAENIDNLVRLSSIIDAIIDLAHETPIIWPLHPRAQGAFAQSGFGRRIRDAGNIKIVAPMLYPDFLAALVAARYVITDSGGIIDECAWLGKVGCILRPTTERATALEASALELCEPADLVQTATNLTNRTAPLVPFRPAGWDGKTANRMLDTLAALNR